METKKPRDRSWYDEEAASRKLEEPGMNTKYEQRYWDLSEQDEMERLRWALSQWRLLTVHLMKGKNLDALPDMGEDEQGSSLSFDHYMILKSETEKLLK